MPKRLTKGTKVKVASGVRAGDVYEYVGDEVDTYNFTTDDANGTVELKENDLVRVGRDFDKDGVSRGFVYRYLGDTKNVDLKTADYKDGDLWGQVGSGELSAQGLQQQQVVEAGQCRANRRTDPSLRPELQHRRRR